MTKIKKFIVGHKIVSALILIGLVLLGYGVTKIFGPSASAKRYVLGTVTRGNIVSSVTGTGQVAALDQIDLKSKVSADVVYLGAAAGQFVPAGALLVALDDTTAKKTVRDAETALASAKLALAKLQDPGQSELTAAQLKKSYQDGVATGAKVYGNLSTIIDSLNTILFNNDFYSSSGVSNNISYYAKIDSGYDKSFESMPQTLQTNYNKLKQEYKQTFADYQSASLAGSAATTDQAIRSTYALMQDMVTLVKTAHDTVQFFQDKSLLEDWTPADPARVAQHLSSLTTYLTTVNGYLSDLGTIVNTIDSQQNTGVGDKLDIQSQELAVKQKENAWRDAEDNLADYTVRAPFSGVLATLNVKKFDNIGSGTVIGTLITKQQIALVSLNEVDAAQVKVGQKATLTFDALGDLSISGQVTRLDLVGTVNQGVVTYEAEVSFDTPDERVKPGMTTSAAIITAVKQDVLAVPNSAVKSRGTGHYVEVSVASAASPREQAVEIGLGNDTLTEITSGLKEGNRVVTRTITQAPTTTTAPSIFGAAGGRGGGGIRTGPAR